MMFYQPAGRTSSSGLRRIAFTSAERKTVMVSSSSGGIVYVLAVQLRFSADRFGRDSVWYTGINGR